MRPVLFYISLAIMLVLATSTINAMENSGHFKHLGDQKHREKSCYVHCVASSQDIGTLEVGEKSYITPGFKRNIFYGGRGWGRGYGGYGGFGGGRFGGFRGFGGFGRRGFGGFKGGYYG